jgi:hypothetical protein
MTDQHPIKPPPELLQQWCDNPRLTWLERLILAYAAGADQELKACCEWAKQFNYDDEYYEDKLRAARRPPSPTEADRALAALEADPKDGAMIMIDSEQFSIIRRALQRLKELEGLAND